ncbi:aldehyde dehydrogenase family protein [Mycobacteroides franklinii]|uniref:Aldehyde dehydrogenase n=1 Tax=Mycobacteroides franklinii TaxID=948102 RepID=A0A4R8R4M9_9MYCO|nr:aldehyde dehydrogenase family protein [Mycobacteroides franklinii]TDZ44002.1 Aldehyde dehydrogenase [Mycobacteroides franklinii]TDZ51136.1 Aldehyde dehydrogenase [Mycobacteroides franklinii]TDZ57556.1 Aldehyde dehydrogenase [Mycobacteroides franklinii]TDZ64498.1 Aldehyde dehydrogenase [Mycobacteroides franklinii]TDZ70895.1 Aldehyde dehydrogenase [Mycobacteroides franklinii]
MTTHFPIQSDDVVAGGGVLGDLRRIFATGRTRSFEWRIRQLEGIENLCRKEESAIAQALEHDLGRNSFEAWMGDIASTMGEATFARKHLKRWMRRRRQPLPLTQRPGRGWVQYDPLGAVLVIGPWNYPVYLSLGPLVAAVSAGNCAVIKPSEYAPATSALLARLIPQYLDPEAIRVVEGDVRVTQSLISEGFDHILFTGGTEVGSKIMAAAAPTLTPVTLELGGKSPVIITADADLDVAARRVVWVKLLNSGQTCIAPDYVLVDSKVADSFIEKVVSTIADFRSGETILAQRIVNWRQFERLQKLIGTTSGSVVYGGGVDQERLSIEPTIIADPAPTDDVMTQEIFGPVLPIVRVQSSTTAAQFVNSRPKPLALYVFAGSQRAGRALIDTIPSGGAVINHVAMHCLVPQLPFGGVGASGMGSYHGRWGFETLSHRRAVLAKHTKPDPAVMYPPYSNRAIAIMRRLL